MEMNNKYIWILGGGAVLGLLLLMGKSGGSSSSGPNYGATLQSMSLANDISTMGMQLASHNADTAAQVGIAQANNNVAILSGAMSALLAVDNAHTLRTAAFNESNAGIFNNIITTRSNVQIARQNAANTMNLVATNPASDAITNMIGAGLLKPSEDVAKKAADTILKDTFISKSA